MRKYLQENYTHYSDEFIDRRNMLFHLDVSGAKNPETLKKHIERNEVNEQKGL